MINQEFSKLNIFQQQMMSSKINMLDKTITTPRNNQDELDSPTKLTNNQLGDVKAKLNKIKMGMNEPNNVTL